MLKWKMYGQSHEGDKYRNRFRFRERASTGLEFNNWMSCPEKQWRFSNGGGWMF